jgi:tetratricopeptide (TPR) repeat protein
MTEQSPAEVIFFAALEKGTTEERVAYLDAACGHDCNLRQRVERLLAAHPQVGSFLEQPAQGEVGAAEASTIPPGEKCPAGPGLAGTTSYHGPSEGVGSIIAGRYKLLETLGQGGMGAVFMAQQTEPVKRLVALKLIKLGMDSKQVLTRFEAERQALALMDHPNIAKVLDAGATDSGRPFFVMELVKGVPITRFCDERQLSTRQRLELFIPVCQAIQHAHQKGVIHRDIKPTNVLVALYDDRPVPKVIDFGVAKAAGSHLTDASLVTGFGAVVGTPEYMSPEQAQLNQLDIDTRSDVYALGVLLYELLTGTTPIDRKRLGQGALLEILRIICEEEPPRPSTRLSTSEALASIAATRRTEPAKLAKLMRGELDWIVMKCLEKDRSRRYETANGLARDLERYLHDEIVEAQPPTAGYRLRKFARKHRTALMTAATILLLLVAGVALSTWQAVRATRAEWQTTQERDRAIQSEREARTLQTRAQLEEQKALKSAAEASAMISFFKELMVEARRTIRQGDGWRAKTVDETVAIIDSAKVRALFADHPLAEAEIREWLATNVWPVGLSWGIHFSRGQKVQGLVWDSTGQSWLYNIDPDTARRHLERALELRAVHLGPNHPKTLATMHQLGQTIMQVDAGKAHQVLGELVARSNAAFGPDNDVTLQYKDSLAGAYEFADKLDDATLLRKDIYTLAKTKLGRDSAEALNRSDNLAAAYEKAGRIEEALRQREESLRGRRKLAAGSMDLSVGNALQEVARLYDQMQDYTRAEPLWREAFQFVKDNKNVMVDVQASLGLCLLRTGKPADAEPVLRQCLATREKKEPDAWTTFHTKSLLGGSLLGQKKYAEAEPLLLAGYEGMKKGLDKAPQKDKVRLIEGLERIVQLYEATGKKDKAEAWRKELKEAKMAGKPALSP